MGIIFFVLLLGYYLIPYFAGKPLKGKSLLIAHRGGPVYNPENTMAAFRQAIADGVDGIEFDVQMTQDGSLVVIHDKTVGRTTNGSGTIKGMTFKELRELDAGNGEKVPTFREVVELAKEANVLIYVEAKSPAKYPGVEEKIVEELKDIGYAQQSLIQSFDRNSVEKFGEIDPSLALAQIYGLWELSVKSPQPGNAQTASIMAEMLILNPWMIWGIHKKGLNVVVWFGILKGGLMMRWILRLGADRMVVNDHRKLAKIIGR